MNKDVLKIQLARILGDETHYRYLSGDFDFGIQQILVEFLFCH